jgi:hypothetical protein
MPSQRLVFNSGVHVECAAYTWLIRFLWWLAIADMLRKESFLCGEDSYSVLEVTKFRSIASKGPVVTICRGHTPGCLLL